MPKPQFVRVRLDETALILFGDIGHEGLNLYEWAFDLVETGYKFSFSCKADTGSFAVYMTGAKGSPNEGKTIGQWGGDISECLSNLWLIHEEFSVRNDWETANATISDRVKGMVAQLKQK